MHSEFIDYASLRKVFQQAYDQASKGKGSERHADSKPFHEQDIVQEAIHVGLAFPVGQARKKSKEAITYTLAAKGPDAAISELLGAINYLAGAVIAIQEMDSNGKRSSGISEREKEEA